MFKNVKTMFKVMNEFKKTDSNINASNETNSKNNYQNDGTPTFFI
jgi:hypothetical protein